MSVKPFLKWVGGKGQLLPEIRKRYPTNFTKYIEPFLGGGSVLFDILQRYPEIEVTCASDINNEIINTYLVVQSKVDELIEFLHTYEVNYHRLENRSEQVAYYTEKRREYNDLSSMGEVSIRKAGLFIFLNKTCYNGLYRVNSNNEFNPPIGSYVKPTICNREELLKCSSLLKGVNFHCCSYNFIEEICDENTFVYCDPPYRPLTRTSNFTTYTKTGFSDEEQIKLAEFLNKISSKGTKLMISNSDPTIINKDDLFFDELYKGFTIDRVMAPRYIAANKNKIRELLITNYNE